MKHDFKTTLMCMQSADIALPTYSSSYTDLGAVRFTCINCGGGFSVAMRRMKNNCPPNDYPIKTYLEEECSKNSWLKKFTLGLDDDGISLYNIY